jgi:D-aminoacyl-tRNA deacylase
MKAVLQRVSEAQVTVQDQVVGRVEQGLLILLGVEQGDNEDDSSFLARKSAELRIFADEHGKMNRSLLDVQGSVLLVSQFTLSADWKKGRRPSFTRAAPPAEGERLYEHFARALQGLGVPVQKGIFGAMMQVALVNDGPVTLILDYQSASDRTATAPRQP